MRGQDPGFRHRDDRGAARQRWGALCREPLYSKARWWTFLICLAVALATVLSVFFFIQTQASVQLPGDNFAVMAGAGLAGIAAGIFTCIAVCLVDALAGHGLLDLITGHEPVSDRWFYLAFLGVVLGAGVGLFSDLAATLLSSHVAS